MNWIKDMKFIMNGKEYTITAVWRGSGKKVSYEFTDKEKIYQIPAKEFESKLTDKNYIGI
jgi:hypothetical protein